MTQVAADRLVATRNGLHRVAEHVLSAARKRGTGHISLVPGPGGVRIPPLEDGTVLALEGTDIVVHRADGTSRRAPVRSVGQAAEFAGTEPGFPWTKHPPGTEFEPDEPLQLDESAARVLAGWFALGDEALRVLGHELVPGAEPTPVIYPEHFDLAVAVADVNYGASPGDASIPSPYLYVGPHEGPLPGDDPFWNATFGAFRTIEDVSSVDDALAFFRAGQERVGRP